jgi:hypothetical protein
VSESPSKSVSRVRRNPAPVLKYLVEKHLLNHDQRILCYGCGQGVDVEWLQIRKYDTVGYDPHAPYGYSTPPVGLHDLVLFNYVLTRLKTEEARFAAIRKAFGHLKPGGRLVITSRTAYKMEIAEGSAAVTAFFQGLLDGCGTASLEILPPDSGDTSVAAIIRKSGIYEPKNPWTWIDTQPEFEELCARLLREPMVGLDVETTLSEPRVLCTIQLGVPGQTWIVDALQFHDLSPIRPVMESEDIIKLIHNADFERMMLSKHQIQLVNVYDTLVVARKRQKKGVSGGNKLGEVCERELQIYLDKSLQTSDWTLRPLSEEQLKYAAIDAEVLVLLHRIFCPPKAAENLELF